LYFWRIWLSTFQMIQMQKGPLGYGWRKEGDKDSYLPTPHVKKKKYWDASAPSFFHGLASIFHGNQTIWTSQRRKDNSRLKTETRACPYCQPSMRKKNHKDARTPSPNLTMPLFVHFINLEYLKESNSSWLWMEERETLVGLDKKYKDTIHPPSI
jgi:hypothetical protein